MEFEIRLNKRFVNRYEKVISYLHEEWGQNIVDEFNHKLEKKLLNLAQQPYLGIKPDFVKDVRSILITKHNRIYYRIKGQTIEIVNMYDTRINPKRNRYK